MTTNVPPVNAEARIRRETGFTNLFFLRRRPRLFGVPREWVRPIDEDDYQKMIHDEGFVSPLYWDQGNLADHPIIAHDAKDLATYLLPTFFEFNQKSRYYQNKFYLYQWVFVIGAFLTTMFGALATLLYVPPNLSAQATAEVERAVYSTSIPWQQYFSYLTAIIGFVTAVTTALSNRSEPQKRWGKTRRLTEELRMHYFTYLSHLAPYDTPDRVQKLRENVINLRVKEQENV